MKNLKYEFDQEFKDKLNKAAGEAKEKIFKHLNQAREELKKAVEVSEQYGIPFESSVSFIDNSYQPGSMTDIWGEDMVEKLFHFYYDDYSLFEQEFPDLSGCSTDFCQGWLHSDVC